ncbi:MAG: transporter substrate-binding domain-containing protein [Sneathiella sp.]|nr:transporter substrate-binding domain-containing protein [Sneathiella sp.]
MKRWVNVSAIAILFVFLSGSLQSKTLDFAVAANTIDTVVSEIIIKKAYEMLGHQVNIIRLPPKRALEDANSGRYDGDVQRIFSVAETYPNLIRIEPPINYIHGTGFVLEGSDIRVNSWQALKDHKVGIILGIRFAETNVPKENVFVFYNYKELTEALNNGRIDIGIYPQSNGIYQVLLMGEKRIIPLKAPLEKFDLYHYIHKKNRSLKNDLQRIFTQFEQDGTLAKVRQRVLDISFRRAKKGITPCFDDYACYKSVWDK